MLIAILILVFGLLFGVRIYFLNEQNKTFDNLILKNTLIITTFLTVLFCLYVRDRAFLVWIIVVSVILIIRVTIFVTGFIREMQFRQDFVEFLDRLILQVRSGNGFRYSLEVSNRQTPKLNQTKLKKIIEAVHFEQKIETTHEFVREICEEFTAIENFPHKTLERLCAFRRKIKIEEIFRRKSGRIVRQIRIQISFLSALYVGILCFAVSRFGFKENVTVILWSVGMFVMGLLVFFYLGMRRQWKI